MTSQHHQHSPGPAHIKTEIFETCRACLHENSQLKSMDENNLRFTYREFTTIEVPESHDTIIPKLCNECVDVLNFFTNFKQKCLKSNEYFLQLTSGHCIASPAPTTPLPSAFTAVKVKDEVMSLEAARKARLKIETVIIDELIEIAPVDAPENSKGDVEEATDENEERGARKLKKSKRDVDVKVAKKERKVKKDKRRKEEPTKSEPSDSEDIKDENEEDDELSEDEFEDGVESAGDATDPEAANNDQPPKKKKKRKMIIDENGEKVYSAQWLAVLEWRDKKEKTSIVDENGQKKFTCDLCPRVYETMHMLRRHETRHKFYKGVVCDLCGLYVCSPAALRKHKSFKHSNNRPYACDKCDGAFKSKWGLHEHERTLHSTERNHICPYPQCGRMFKSNSRLHAHRKMVHEAERRYHCLICDKKFKKSYVLKRHQLKHSGDKAFSCEICAKPFSTKHACTAHQKIHSMEKNKYLCKICSNLFSNKRHARKHIREAHPGESVVSQVVVMDQNDLAQGFQNPTTETSQQQQTVLMPQNAAVQVLPMEQVIEIATIQLHHLGHLQETPIQQMPPSC